MQLTREQAIAEHRKMWNWIAEQIESKKVAIDIWDSKRVYLQINGIEPIMNDCFLCEYKEQFHEGRCKYLCPVTWGEIGDSCMFRANENELGLFDECVNSEDWQEQSLLARKIANLPERTDVRWMMTNFCCF